MSAAICSSASLSCRLLERVDKEPGRRSVAGGERTREGAGPASSQTQLTCGRAPPAPPASGPWRPACCRPPRRCCCRSPRCQRSLRGGGWGRAGQQAGHSARHRGNPQPNSLSSLDGISPASGFFCSSHRAGATGWQTGKLGGQAHRLHPTHLLGDLGRLGRPLLAAALVLAVAGRHHPRRGRLTACRGQWGAWTDQGPVQRVGRAAARHAGPPHSRSARYSSSSEPDPDSSPPPRPPRPLPPRPLPRPRPLAIVLFGDCKKKRVLGQGGSGPVMARTCAGQVPGRLSSRPTTPFPPHSRRQITSPGQLHAPANLAAAEGAVGCERLLEAGPPRPGCRRYGPGCRRVYPNLRGR